MDDDAIATLISLMRNINERLLDISSQLQRIEIVLTETRGSTLDSESFQAGYRAGVKIWGD